MTSSDTRYLTLSPLLKLRLHQNNNNNNINNMLCIMCFKLHVLHLILVELTSLGIHSVQRLILF